MQRSPWLRKTITAACLLTGSLGCSSHHWAEVETGYVPPPDGPTVIHTSRLVVSVSDATNETQCKSSEIYRPVCFYNVRPALERALARSLWPSFPEVVFAKATTAEPGDYILELELHFDALPPDAEGPGWSTGAQARYRLRRDDQTLLDETLSTRSRADLAYGEPLGLGAKDTLDATVLHVAARVSQTEESRPDLPRPLPGVAVQAVLPRAGTSSNSDGSEAPSPRPEKAKTNPTADVPPPPPLQ